MKNKYPKDINSEARARFIRCFGYPFILFGAVGLLIGAVTGGIIGMLAGLLAAAVLSLIAAMITTVITNQAGNVAGGMLFGAGRSTFSRRERLEGDLSQVRHYKMRGETRIALEKVNALLEKDSNYPEAVFLRAQLLLERQESRQEAARDLKRVLELVPSREESLHRWALRLLADVYREKG